VIETLLDVAQSVAPLPGSAQAKRAMLISAQLRLLRRRTLVNCWWFNLAKSATNNGLVRRSKRHRYSITSSPIETIERAKGPPPVSVSLKPVVPLTKKLSRNRWEQQ
jgi:hypothetical protein